MRINQNLMAFNAARNLSATNTQMGKSLEKLSSGFRINRAADDAAGLVISQKLRAQSSGLKVATRNAQDGVSVVQTAEGALTEVHSMLNRIRDLAVQASNEGGNDSASRTAADAEVDQLVSDITRIASQTKFGGTALLNGSYTNQAFQVGANNGETLTFSVSDMSASGLGLTTVDITTVTGAQAALNTLDTAIATVSTTRGSLGALQNRFESIINNLQVTTENISASESRIRDADMAQETVTFTRNQILLQAGTSMLSQANQVPQSVLSLLR
jgi:flagellin